MKKSSFIIFNFVGIVLLVVASCSFSSNTTTTSVDSLCPDDNHPHAIDLGLPSETRWACCNYGANEPENFGDYLAWGERKAKATYRNTYLYYNGCSNIWENIGDNISGTSEDVAYVEWGRNWQMPNSEQLNELMSYCNYQWVKYHGARGGLFTGENGNSIFLPAAGIKRYESQEEKLCGFYWLSEICNFDNQVAYTIELSQNGVKHEI